MQIEEEIVRLQQQIKALSDNDERHEDNLKTLTTDIRCIRKELIKEISNRLPTWAVFLLSGMTACIGWLASMVVL